MHDPLHRLYRTKLALLASLLLFVGIALLILGHWVRSQPQWRWLTNWPIIDIGSGLFTTGLLGVAYQYVDGRDSEVRDTERLKRVLAESTPAMRDAVIAGFAFEPEDVARVATPEVLDKIITNGLAIRLGDRDFANDLYADLRSQAVDQPERLHDTQIRLRLSPGPAAGRPTAARSDLFTLTVRWEFKVIPHYAVRRFSCVSELDEFRDIKQDTAATSAWYIGSRTGLDAGAQEMFELVEFTVDGRPRPIRRTAKTGSQTYSVSLGAERHQDTPVTIAYTYRTIARIDDRVIQLRIDQPTKRLSIELDYSDTDLEHVNVLDFLATGERAQLTKTPAALPGKSVGVELDSWVFPGSGVTFVWFEPQGSRAAKTAADQLPV